MNRKTASFIGLPVGLVLGFVAVALALGLFSTAAPPLEARSTDGAGINGVSDLISASVAGAPVSQAITGVTVTLEPDKPGDAARYEVRFTTTTALSIGEQIIVDFHQNFQVPTSITASQVTVRVPDHPTSGAQGAVAASEVTVSRVGTDQRHVVRVMVPDLNPADDATAGIPANEEVVVVFSQSANIRNPNQARPMSTAGAYSVIVRTTTDPTNVTTTVPFARVVELSAANGPRGTQLTLLARGYQAGTVTFWRDADGDGVRQAAEIELCSAPVGADSTATCTYTVTNPPFVPGSAGTGGSCAFGAISLCNLINARDGNGNTAGQSPGSGLASALVEANLADHIFDLRGSVTASPAAGNPGDTITIQLRDFPAGALTATSVTLGGQAIANQANNNPINALSVPASGELNFNIRIPDGISVGSQTLGVGTPSASIRTTTVNVGGASVTVTPDTVVANQRISITGSGFTGNANIANHADGPGSSGTITIGGQAIDGGRIAAGTAVTADAGGTWSASIDLPVLSATTTPGTVELKITDSSGREGVATVTINERTMNLNPAQSGVGTDVTITGQNYPARNDDGSSINVEVRYDAGAAGTATTMATPDASGNFSVVLRVPTNSAIPSTNTIRTTFTDDQTVQVINTVTHRVPEARITISPTSGPAGTTVTVTGEGFRRFATVSSVRVGTLTVTPSPAPNTDGEGRVSMSVQIPGIESGTQTVEVTVGTTTASAGFTVGVAAPVDPSAQSPADAMSTPLGENLVRVWHFNNETQSWTFYDPRPAFADANTLMQVSPGQVYWVRVNENQTATLGPCGSKNLFAPWSQIACVP